MIRSISRPCSAGRRRRVRTAADVILAGVVTVVALTGCSDLSFRDDICSDDEYPVMTVGATGSACVKDGEKVPEGHTRYPKGKVPQKVDDKWDVYWRTHTVDEKGNTVDAPAGR